MPSRFRYLFLILLLCCPLLRSQTSTATIRGRVKDPSGASIPAATVHVVNSLTGTSVQATTGQDGNFVVPYLLPGQYTLTAEDPGFQRFEQTGITLDVQQVLSLDILLEVGSASTTVNVNGTPPTLDASSSSVSTTIENQQVVGLPLNGRVALGLATLVPGVIPGGGAAGSSIGAINGSIYMTSYTPWIAGSRNATSDVLMDGVPLGVSNGSGTLDMGYSGPTIDAEQEFTVLINSLPAEYGRTGGGIVNIASKGGTNRLHGTLYEFLRNSDMDANNFFNNRSHIARPVFQRNQFGGTVGGPVYIPRIYDGRDRTFFFFDTETTLARAADTFATTVPLDAWKQGDFSSLMNSAGQPITIYDPTTTLNTNGQYVRSPFPGNVIPASRMDPVALNIMKYFPEPNTTPLNTYTQLNNWTGSGTDALSSSDYAMRVDENFSSSWRSLFVMLKDHSQ